MDGGRTIEIDRPRSAPELIGATFALYRRYPWLFLVLAAGGAAQWPAGRAWRADRRTTCASGER